MRRSPEDNADERNNYIKMALGALSDADKASNTTVLDKTREIIKVMFRGDVGAKLAANITNGVQLKHIEEYKDSHQQARAPLPSQITSSSSSSSSYSGASRLGKEAVMGAVFEKEEVEARATAQENAAV